MKTDLNDTTPDAINPQQEGTETTTENEGDGEIRRAFQLEEALKKERQQAKQAAKKAAELEAELKRIKEQYDPDRLKTLEERELIRQQQFEKLAETKARELEETRNQATTYQKQLTELQIQTAVTTAFYKAGGRDEMLNPDPDLDDVSPSETVLKLLRDRIQVQDGKVVILDKYGQVEMINNRPKTLLEEMQKLRKGSLSGLFYAENTNEGMGTIQSVNANGKVVPAYSREQARMGKASIEDIAKGKAIIR